MPKPIMTGSVGPIFGPIEFDYDPKYGVVIRQPIRGSVDYVRSQSIQLQTFKVPHNYREDGNGMAEITAVQSTPLGDPNTESPVDGWQLLGSSIDKSIYEHPTILAAEDDDVIALRDSIEEKDGLLCPESLFEFWQLAMRDVLHYRTVNYVLRHTQTVSNQYTKDIPDENVYRIYKTQTLLNYCSGFPVPLYPRLKNKIGSIPVPNAQTDYAVGWLRQPSSETPLANNRIEVTNDWVLEQWSTVIYGAAL